MNITKSNRQ